MQQVQEIVLGSTILIFALTALLAIILTRGYLSNKRRSHLFWSIGLWTFAVSVFLEIVFALGVTSSLLLGAYFFLVVVLVEMLALGSMELIQSSKLKKIYYSFTLIITAAVAYSAAIGSFGSNLITNYVVTGNPPTLLLYLSIIATFVASIIIVVIAAIGYKRTRNKKLLSIIAGVIVVASAGTLYITSFPVFLYYSEFFGILLLWIGFFDFSTIKHSRNKL